MMILSLMSLVDLAKGKKEFTETTVRLSLIWLFKKKAPTLLRGRPNHNAL